MPETQRYPYQNKSLEDLPGEIWKEVPGWTDYAVSNLGRVKSKDRLVIDKRGMRILRKGTIISQQVLTSNRPFNKGKRNYLKFKMSRETIKKQLLTSRIVYYLFVKEIVIENRKQIIQYKDGDSLNVSAANLFLTSVRNKMKKYWAKNRYVRPERKILQYYHNGILKQVFNSMRQACMAGKFSVTKLRQILGKAPYKGYLWRSAELKWLEAFSQKSREIPKPIIQYSLQGEKLAEYLSLQHAAEKMRISPPYIKRVLGDLTKMCRGFRWGWAKPDVEAPNLEVNKMDEYSEKLNNI